CSHGSLLCLCDDFVGRGRASPPLLRRVRNSTRPGSPYGRSTRRVNRRKWGDFALGARRVREPPPLAANGSSRSANAPAGVVGGSVASLAGAPIRSGAMDLSFSPRAEAFRAELRAWLAEHAPREGVDSADFA